jgi:hypothetical protein
LILPSDFCLPRHSFSDGGTSVLFGAPPCHVVVSTKTEAFCLGGCPPSSVNGKGSELAIDTEALLKAPRKRRFDTRKLKMGRSQSF